MNRVQTGLDVLLARDIGLISGRKIGLITNRSAVTSDRVPACDALVAAGVIVKSLFAPEHGFRAELREGEHVPNSIDPGTELTIHSLYGETRKPTPEMLDGLDMLVFDIQDVGARFYTFLYTMAYAMQGCAEAGLPFVVLDRPNPIGGVSIEGPVLDPRFSSFVGLYPIPIRSGMTIGELASLFNMEFGIDADLRVVRLEGWRREMWFDRTGLPWVPPSPNMPSLDSAAVYPGTCLFEGTNVSEGRGTAAPFQTIGAPWIDAAVLAREMNRTQLPGVRFDPISFVPTASKHKGEHCGGVRIDVLERESFRPVLTGVKLIETIRKLQPDQFAFAAPGADGRSFFDLLAGTDEIRLGIEAGLTGEQIASSWSAGIVSFQSIREKYLFYDSSLRERRFGFIASRVVKGCRK